MRRSQSDVELPWEYTAAAFAGFGGLLAALLLWGVATPGFVPAEVRQPVEPVLTGIVIIVAIAIGPLIRAGRTRVSHWRASDVECPGAPLGRPVPIDRNKGAAIGVASIGIATLVVVLVLSRHFSALPGLSIAAILYGTGAFWCARK